MKAKKKNEESYSHMAIILPPTLSPKVRYPANPTAMYIIAAGAIERKTILRILLSLLTGSSFRAENI